jgi:uncharacterized membrane protein YpjA
LDFGLIFNNVCLCIENGLWCSAINITCAWRYVSSINEGFVLIKAHFGELIPLGEKPTIFASS